MESYVNDQLGVNRGKSTEFSQLDASLDYTETTG